MSTTSPSRRTEAGSARPLLVLLLAVVMFAAGAATSWWWLTQQPSRPVAVATPPPDFGPLTPSPVTSPDAAPSEGPPPSTQVAEVAPPASTLTPGRPGAAASRGLARAAAPPLPPAVAPPGSKPVPAPAHGTRSFVLGTTEVQSLRPLGRDLSGFDTDGVGVKRAPKVEGTIELVMEPPQVKAGEAYSVKVFLKNEGRKPIDVGDMKVSMIVDGKSSTRPLPAKARQVAPQQRALLEELPGVWRGDVGEWAVEAIVTSKQQDVYRNRLTWK